MAELNKNDLFSEDLLKAPYELAQGLGLVVNQIDKITAASKQSETVLKGTTSASKIAKETQNLTVQEKELLKVQNQISVALAKNNDEYIEHKRGLDAINRAVKEKINKGREDLTFTGQMKNAMKDLKNELKEARNAMLLAADAGGTMSKEYQDAAKQAGEIADKIGDAKDEAKVFANDTAFGALGTRVGLLKDKVMSLDFKGVGEQLKGLGKIILANPILLLIGVLTGIGAAVYALRDKVPALTAVFDAVGKSIDYVVQLGKDFLDWAVGASFAADDKAAKIAEAANKEIQSITERYDQEIKLAQAAGKETIDLEIKKQKAIRDTAYLQVRSLLALSKQREGLSEEQQKQLDEFVKITSDAVNTLDVLEKQKAAKEEKRYEEYLKREAEKQKIRVAEQQAILNQIEADKIKAIQDEEKHKAELERMAEHAEKVNEYAQSEYDHINSLEQEKTENFLSLSELREQRAMEEAERQMAFVTDLNNAIVASALSNDKSLRTLAKNFAIFALNTLERQLVPELVARATARALASGLPFIAAIARGAQAGVFAKGLFTIAKGSIARFATGTDSAPGGLAYVGERGRELIVTPSGHVSLSPNKETLTHLPAGSMVIPNEETMRILASNSLRGVSSTRSGDFILYGKLTSLENTIRETNDKIAGAVDRSNGKIFNHGSLIYEMKQKADGSKKLIRLKSLSK